MLPAETLADVVTFLGYYDLGGLKLANKLLSAVASQCADAIRLFDFSNFTFVVQDDQYDPAYTIGVARLDSNTHSHCVCTLKFGSENEMVVFISEAFRNCTVGRLRLLTSRERVLNALKGVADTVTVTNLHVPDELVENLEEFIDFVDSFRRVKVLMVSVWDWTLDIRLLEFCELKKILLRL